MPTLRQVFGLCSMFAGVGLTVEIFQAWWTFQDGQVLLSVPAWEFALLGIPAAFFFMAYGLLFEKRHDDESFDFLTPQHVDRVQSFGRAVQEGHIARARKGKC